MPYKTKGLEAYNKAGIRHLAASTRSIPCREDILDIENGELILYLTKTDTHSDLF